MFKSQRYEVNDKISTEKSITVSIQNLVKKTIQ